MPRPGCVVPVDAPTDAHGTAFAQDHHPDTEPFFGLELGALGFVFVWLSMLALHAVNGVFLGATGALYRYFMEPNMLYILESFTTLPDATFGNIGYVFMALSAVHGACILEVLYWSIRQCELSFGKRPAQAHKHRAKPARSKGKLHRLLCKAVHLLVSEQGIFGVESHVFDAVYTTREVLEIGVQSYQAYSYSVKISTVWMNNVAVACIVINCLSTPVMRYFFHHHVPLQRLLCVISDTLLSFACSVVIPFCIFVPYWREFDVAQQTFAKALIYDDVWYIKAMREMQQIFASSKIELISLLFPHLSLLSCFATLKMLIRRKQRKITSHDGGPSIAAFGPLSDFVAKPAPQQHYHYHHTRDTPHQRRYKRLSSALFTIWGLFILAVHIYAHNSASSEVAGCKNYVNAWFAAKFSCAIMMVNCYRRNINGTAEEIHDILVLEIPSTIQSFHNMLGTEIYNSTLVEWSATSAVTNQDHPVIGYVFFARANFSRFPDGLLDSDFPAELVDLEFSNCHMPEFPDTIAIWGYMGTLTVESSNVTQLPSALTELQVDELCFGANLIQDISDALLVDQELAILLLSDNPLQALPATIGSIDAVQYLLFERTNVTEVPDWFEPLVEFMRENVADYLAAGYGSPYCDRVLDAIANDPTSLTALEQTFMDDVCYETTYVSSVTYPISLVDRQRVP